MSEIAWLCYRSRFPSKGVQLVMTCTAPDLEAAITKCAFAFGQSHAEFSRGLAAWQKNRTQYYVVSAVAQRAGVKA